MSKLKLLPEFYERIDKAEEDLDKICNDLGISLRTGYRWLKRPKVEEKPTTSLSIDELLSIRDTIFKNKTRSEDYKSGTDVEFKDNLPIGILHFGDMHLDSDGVDLQLVDSHIKLLRETQGLYGGNLGDTTNNWVGFLGKLYGEQHTTVEESIQLIEHYIGKNDWLYTIVGNHDKWNGGEYVIRQATKYSGVTGDDIRLILKFPNGSENTLRARHHFKGSSQYNNAQGSVKEALLGTRDDIIIHGHTHSLGYSIVPQPETKRLSHALSVGSYKQIDSYKIDMGFRDDNLSPCVVTIIDPNLSITNPDRIKVFFDPYVGANYLTELRKGYDL
jgi:calcineurin-like phosphoesterase family protein